VRVKTKAAKIVLRLKNFFWPTPWITEAIGLRFGATNRRANQRIGTSRARPLGGRPRRKAAQTAGKNRGRRGPSAV
jgi:hypothetical protein